MIEVKELSKSYNERTAIDKITFSARKGEILGFLGPNGAGKSTTMKILSGFMGASSGTAIVNGFDVNKQSLQARASIGYLPENPPVYNGMEVDSYLAFAAQLHGVEKHKVKKAVNDAMEKCGISDVRSRLIGNLSKGYRQRVGLAQAIAHNPAVLILDEPTVGLDPRQIIDIRNLIKSFEKDHTVILSTHILPEVQATCSRVVVIDHGKVIAEDSLAGIAARMQASQRLTITLKHDPSRIVPQVHKLNGVRALTDGQRNPAGEYLLILECAKDADLREKMAELCVQERLGLLGLQLEQFSLEDAFVRLISHDETTRDINVEAGN